MAAVPDVPLAAVPPVSGRPLVEGGQADAPDFVGPRHDLRERLLLRLLLGAQPGPRIVDVGAGGGSFSRRLIALGFDVTSVDISETAIQRLEGGGLGTVVTADATTLPFEPASFDAAVLAEVLEHIEHDVAALEEARRVLRPHGVLVVSVPADPARFGPSDAWAVHVRRYSRSSLVEACERAGFGVERCVPWGFPVSTLYHRYVYERHLERFGPALPSGWRRFGVPLLRALIQIDRLFVGVERGALGFLLVARSR